MKLKERLKPYDITKPKPNEIIKYRCYDCNAVFEVKDLSFDYTYAVYCICCGSDTLVNTKTNERS